MNINISEDARTLGERAARLAAEKINEAIAERGEARVALSTGASQFTTLEALAAEMVDWSRVELFHLDEYAGISPNHPASFCRYIKERFADKLPIKCANYIYMDGDMEEMIRQVTERIREKPVDVGLIGIGENAHVAFNDPPADYETNQAYIVVSLDEACRRQQVREGWFADIDSVPREAVTMTVRQIMSCRSIISAVPFNVKAQAVQKMMMTPVDHMVPATILKTHSDLNLFLDRESAALICR